MTNKLAVGVAEHAREQIETWQRHDTRSDSAEFPEGTGPEHLLWMCEQIISNQDVWPESKLHRWAGYIQGCLVCHGFSTLEGEKDAVRQLKNSYPEE